MLPATPLTVSIATQRTSSVLDPELALSRHGPLFALRLAQEVNVWLVRALWWILDDSYKYLHGGDLPVGTTDGAREALTQWEAIRLENDFAGLKMYWISDAKQESLLPEGCDPNLVQRFDVLKAGLDEGSDTDFQTLEFYREAIALTAALTRHPAVIFTSLPLESDAEPYICEVLRRNQSPCRRIEADDQQRSLKRDWSAAFSRTGINELIWSGLRPAIVHVVAPRALVLPAANMAYSSSNAALDIQYGEDKERNLWEQAEAFWYPVGP